MTADVRVGIVTWNSAGEIGACLDSLPDALGSLRAEIVIVDNASEDDSAEVAASRNVHVIRNAINTGYARGMNAALSGTAAPTLIALNPDTVAPPGSLAALVEHLREHPAVGLVVPSLLNPDGTIQHSLHPFPSLATAVVVNLLPARLLSSWRQRHWMPGRPLPKVAGDIDWAIGAVHVIRREALDGRLPYTENSFIYVEDLDLCDRLDRRGWRVQHRPDIVVTHVGNVSGEQAFGATREARYWAETYRWAVQRHGAGWARLYAFLNLLGVLVRAFSRRIRRRSQRRGARNLVSVHRSSVLRPGRWEAPAAVTSGSVQGP